MRRVLGTPVLRLLLSASAEFPMAFSLNKRTPRAANGPAAAALLRDGSVAGEGRVAEVLHRPHPVRRPPKHLDRAVAEAILGRA